MKRVLIVVMLGLVLLGSSTQALAAGGDDWGPKEPEKDAFLWRSKKQVPMPHENKKGTPLDHGTTGDTLSESRSRAMSGIWRDWEAELEGEEDGKNPEDDTKPGSGENENGHTGPGRSTTT